MKKDGCEAAVDIADSQKLEYPSRNVTQELLVALHQWQVQRSELLLYQDQICLTMLINDDSHISSALFAMLLNLWCRMHSPVGANQISEARHAPLRSSASLT